MDLTCYIVGPISGLKGPEVRAHFGHRARVLRDMGYSVLNPVAGKKWLTLDEGDELAASGYDHPISTDQAIYQRDQWMCLKADIIVADLRDAKYTSIGSCFELAWASQAGKQIVIIGLTDDHPMNHAFVKQAGSVFFDTEAEALTYMQDFLDDLK